VVVGAGAEELGAEARVPVGQVHHLPGHFLLGALGRQVQAALQAQGLGNAHEEILGAGDADRVQEGPIFGRGGRQIAHGGLGKEANGNAALQRISPGSRGLLCR
jgi:hypothetical protein